MKRRITINDILWDLIQYKITKEDLEKLKVKALFLVDFLIQYVKRYAIVSDWEKILREYENVKKKIEKVNVLTYRRRKSILFDIVYDFALFLQKETCLGIAPFFRKM